MPYRGAPPRRAETWALPTRLVAFAALVVLAGGLPSFPTARSLWFDNFGGGPRLAHLLWAARDLPYAGLAVAGALLAKRTPDRRMRRFATAGAVCAVAVLAIDAWCLATNAPSFPRAVEIASVLASCALTFALVPRHLRALALTTATIAGGILARELVDAFEVPSDHARAPDPLLELLIHQITGTFALLPPLGVALAAWLRRGEEEPTNPSPYLAVAEATAAVAVVSAAAGAFGLFYEMALTVVGELRCQVRIVELERQWRATSYAHGALIAASAFVVIAAQRNGRRTHAAIAGIATGALALVSWVMFSAVREEPFPDYEWANVQALWAALVAIVVLVGAKLTHEVRRDALVSAASERVDLATMLEATVGKTLRHAFFAAGTGAVAIMLTAASEMNAFGSNRYVLANGGGLAGLVAIAFAFGAVLEHARKHAHVDEGIRRATSDSPERP